MECEHCQKANHLIGYGVCIACNDKECNPLYCMRETKTINCSYSTYMVIKEVGNNESQL